MKKMIFTLLLFPIVLLAQSFLISNIPTPKSYIQNLDPYPCDEECMQEYIDQDMIFSFLAHAQSKLENEEHNEFRNMYISILNLGSSIINQKIRIALLLPYKRIGKYAASTTNASFAYLITKNQSFELKSYKIENESTEDIQEALLKIQKDGFYHVIAPFTRAGAQILSDINPEITVFFPTINKQDVQTNSLNLYFGGIDYRAQSDLLLKEAVSPLIIFHDSSELGKRLAQYEADKFKEEIATPRKKTISYSISKGTTNLQRYLKDNKELQDSTCFINTPIVKSSMILSQLTLYDANTTNILSTQINYDPLILSMTQYVDRKNMLIANSITEHNNVLIQTNALLSNDIEYDWINYTTTVGIDYFFHRVTNADREYDIEIRDNQMLYPIELLKPSLSRFVTYTPSSP